MTIIDDLMVALPIAMVLIALLLAGALRVTRRPKTGVSQPGFGRAAGDPFFLPHKPSAGALRRNENGGRPASPSGTAVVLTFLGRKP